MRGPRLPAAMLIGLFAGCTGEEIPDPSGATGVDDRISTNPWAFGELEVIDCVPGDNGIETGFTQTPIHGRTASGALLVLYTVKTDDGMALRLRRRLAGGWSRLGDLAPPDLLNAGAEIGKSSLYIADPYTFAAWSERIDGANYIVTALSEDAGESWSAPMLVETVAGGPAQLEVNGTRTITLRGTEVMGVSLYGYVEDGLPGMAIAWEERYYEGEGLASEETHRNIFSRAWRPTDKEAIALDTDWAPTTQLSLATENPADAETGENVALGGYGSTIYAMWEFHSIAEESEAPETEEEDDDNAVATSSRFTYSTDGGATFAPFSEDDPPVNGQDAHLAHTGDYLYAGIQGRIRTFLYRCCEAGGTCEDGVPACKSGQLAPAWEGRLEDPDGRLVACDEGDDGCISRGLFSQISADPGSNNVAMAYKRWQPDPCQTAYKRDGLTGEDAKPTTGDHAVGLWYGMNDLEERAETGKMLENTAYDYDYSLPGEDCLPTGYFHDENLNGEYDPIGGDYDYVGNWEHGIRSAVTKDHLDLLWIHAFDNIGTDPYPVETHDGVEDLYLPQIETYTERTGQDCGVEDHLLIHFGATPTQELQPL